MKFALGKTKETGEEVQTVNEYLSFTHSDFVFSRQVGPFTQQLGLRQGEDTGRFPDQHCVVQLSVSWG